MSVAEPYADVAGPYADIAEPYADVAGPCTDVAGPCTDVAGAARADVGPEALRSLGLLPAASIGVQVDITAVTRRSGQQLVDTYLCDHNCTITYRGRPTGGHYNCPAAFSLNRGAIAASIAPAGVLLEGLRRIVEAAQGEQARFLATEFPDYADAFRLPAPVAALLHRCLSEPSVEVTLFGGSPEAHPAILDLVSSLRSAGHTVHITMTGRRVVREPAFLRHLAAAGVNVIALSADDFDSVDDLHRLIALDPDELRSHWRRVPATHGQRQKVYEALYTARLLHELPAASRPALLLNIAVHPGNVAAIAESLTTLSTVFPGVALNPFPIQSAFEDRHSDAPESYLESLSEFVAAAIWSHHRRAGGQPQPWSIVPRLHYWLALRAGLDAGTGVAGDHVAGDSVAADRVAGWNTWRCYRSAGAGRYIQVAGSGGVVTTIAHAGGRMGCFWNDSLTDHALPAVWQADVDELTAYLKTRPERARGNARPCAGCLFPRLVGDMVSLETGLDPALHEHYLALRRDHLGF